MKNKKLLGFSFVLVFLFCSVLVFGSDYSEVWNGGPGGLGDDVPNYIRGWGITICDDIDGNGVKEFASFDGTATSVYVWESTGDNQYSLVWHHACPVDENGASVLNGGDRSVMSEDLDGDGRPELIVVWDSKNPNTTGGFNAIEVYKHDASSGEFLPDEPTASFDPPRDTSDRTQLEYASIAKDVDNDGVVELLLTNRGGRNILFTVISIPGKDLSNPDWLIEYCDSTTTSDSTRFAQKFYNLSLTDFNADGLNDMLVSLSGTPAPIVIYSALAANSYGVTVYDTSGFPTEYVGIQCPMYATDVNKDGSQEIYLCARGGMKVWVVTDCNSLSTAFQEENFHLIYDIALTEDATFSTNDLRGGCMGDADNNGRPNFYFGARKNLDALFDMEYIGGDGGDVTDPDNYLLSKIYNDEGYTDISNDVVAMQYADLDGDGDDHLDMVFCFGSANAGITPGIFVYEHNATSSKIQSDASGNLPSAFVLNQNFPNPFNPSTLISYDLNKSSNVKLAIYNVRGQEVRTIVNEYQNAGSYTNIWDGMDNLGNMSESGVYIYKLECDDQCETMKMVLIK